MEDRKKHEVKRRHVFRLMEKNMKQKKLENV